MRITALVIATYLLAGICSAAPARQRPQKNKLPELVYRHNGVYSIMEAAAAGDIQTINARVQEGCNVNQIDEQGYSALHIAAEKNATRALEILLKSGADSKLKTPDGKTAADLARSGKAKQLLQAAEEHRNREIEICEKTAAGDMNFLSEAIRKKGFNPNILNKENNQSLLMIACRQGNPQIVKALIDAGADVNYVSPARRSVLHVSVDADNAEIITLLLNAGANPMAQAGNKAVPLHDAVWSSRMNSIRALLPAYKNINYSPPGGHNGTPIELAINRNFPHVVQLFIDAGIDLNDPEAQNPPLIQAAQTGKPEIVKLLLKAGADKNLRNKKGQRAADAAADTCRNLL